jgi:NitT/TauT family transport system ATP-binding protein
VSAVLEITVRRKAYAGRSVLADLHLSLGAGERVALMGPSGVGKSTLARLITGVERDFEGEGPICRGRLGVVFQEPRLLPWRSVRDNARLATQAAGLPDPPDRLFAEVGLAEAADAFPGALSLGMARRAALARALAIEPDVLVLDEPFASLDAETVVRLRALIDGAVRARGTAMLLITHAREDALALTDRVLTLQGRPATLLREPDPTPMPAVALQPGPA